MKKDIPTLGVVIVTYRSSDVIRDCLETLFAASEGVAMNVVVVDNASPDSTLDVVRDWADGTDGFGWPQDLPFDGSPVAKPIARDRGDGTGSYLQIIEGRHNGGFAYGVNLGLSLLAQDPTIDRFWVLNPDCVVPPGTPRAFARFDPGPFSIMGGRVTYFDKPDMVQIDGGKLNRWTGVTGNYNLFQSFSDTLPPPAHRVDFITGACMVASREFYETTGPLPEDYFLYYEEVDWAMQRGDLPLAICPEARVYHKTGTSIGSPTHGRSASPFSLYFKYRARIKFVRKHFRTSLPIAWTYILAKIVQYRLKGWKPEAAAILDGALGKAPSPEIRARLSDSVIARL